MAYTEAEKKKHIEEIQQYLRAISYVDRNIPRIVPDGIYGPETRRAVEIFQQEHDLPVTGNVDEATWNELYKEYDIIVRLNNYIASISPFANVDYTLNLGDTGYIVYLIQSMLNTIAQFYANISLVDMTGKIDDATQNTIKQLQDVTMQDKTGNIDLSTWNNLAKLYDIHIREAYVDAKTNENAANNS